jgi:hypothetical protein
MSSENHSPVEWEGPPDIDADRELIRGLAQQPVSNIFLAIGALESEIATTADPNELRRKLRHHAKALKHVGLELSAEAAPEPD